MRCSFFVVARMVFITVFFAVVGLFSHISMGGETGKAQGDLDSHLKQVQEILSKAQSSYTSLKDYTAVIHKEEYNGGKVEKDERTIIKFQKPFKVYLKWLSGENEGTQLLYVEGKYDDKMIIRKGGGFLKKVFGTMEMDPDGFWLKKFTKHSIKEVGFGGIIDQSNKQLEVAQEKGLVKAAQCTMSEVDGRPAWKMVLVVAPEAKKDGYYCQSSIQYFDAETFLPVKATFWLWENDMAEVMTFSDIKLNVNLPEIAFDKDNKEYHF